ncbi:MAG: PAS domain-containing protein [Alphaproteobacteria bacterium]|nr:PAS domain-containing protein [Alphaproteobacteria bacterium]
MICSAISSAPGPTRRATRGKAPKAAAGRICLRGPGRYRVRPEPGAQRMQDDLASLIRNTATRVRARDLTWVIAIAAGIGAVLVGLGRLDWKLAVAAFVAFGVALAVRYRFSSARLWAEPVQRIVDAELAAREAEISSLRLARGVAQALPEPLIIIDGEGVIELANPAAEEFVGAPIEGRHLATAVRAATVFETAEAVLRNRSSQTVDFVTAGAVERSCRAFIAPLDGGESRALIFIRDLTSERRLEQMRADFIASASHELRTPLASLTGFIETLRGPAKGDEEARERFLTIMQAQAERMQRLVADLMSLSRIELNEHVPPNAPLDLAETARDVIDSIQPLLEQSGAIVDFECAGDGPFTILGDKDEIFQAIQNLIDNALKYGGDPALVKVRVGRGPAPSISSEGEIAHRAGDSAAQIAARRMIPADDLVYLSVRDFGPGIERSDLPRLTERFYRVNVERSRKSGGTGLGLAIVKHIVNRHKGGLQVESRLGGGTAFVCYFKGVKQKAAVPATA